MTNNLRESLKKTLNKGRSGDLLSNCCAWDFDPFGVEKGEGIYQEKCLKCGKLCEPLYIGAKDIANIRRLEKLEKPKTEEPKGGDNLSLPLCEPKDTCTCACHKSENMAVHTGQHCCSRAYEIFGPQPKEEWDIYSKEGKYNFTPAQRRFIRNLLQSERAKYNWVHIASDKNLYRNGVKMETHQVWIKELLDELKEAGDE